VCLAPGNGAIPQSIERNIDGASIPATQETPYDKSKPPLLPLKEIIKKIEDKGIAVFEDE
jgi:hypothetical protein